MPHRPITDNQLSVQLTITKFAGPTSHLKVLHESDLRKCVHVLFPGTHKIRSNPTNQKTAYLASQVYADSAMDGCTMETELYVGNYFTEQILNHIL